MKINDLVADMRNVDIRFRLINKGEKREISTRDGKVLNLSEAEIGDNSGRIMLTLWDQFIETLDVGDIGEVRNGFIKVVKNELRLNIGKYGELVKIEDDKEFIKEEEIPKVFSQPPENYKPPYNKKRYRK